jgi:hypothetical protein
MPIRTMSLLAALLAATGAFAAPQAPGATVQGAAASAEPAVIALPAATLARYVGHYQLTPDVEVVISAEGEHLYGALTGRPAHELFPTSPTEFFTRDADAQARFELGPDGRPTGLSVRLNGQDMHAQRTDGAATDAPMP